MPKEKKKKDLTIRKFLYCVTKYSINEAKDTKTSNRTKGMKGSTLTHWGVSGEKRELCFFYLHVSVSFKLLE